MLIQLTKENITKAYQLAKTGKRTLLGVIYQEFLPLQRVSNIKDIEVNENTLHNLIGLEKELNPTGSVFLYLQYSPKVSKIKLKLNQFKINI